MRSEAFGEAGSADRDGTPVIGGVLTIAYILFGGSPSVGAGNKIQIAEVAGANRRGGNRHDRKAPDHVTGQRTAVQILDAGSPTFQRGRISGTGLKTQVGS